MAVMPQSLRHGINTGLNPLPARSLARFSLGNITETDTILLEMRQAPNRPNGDRSARSDLRADRWSAPSLPGVVRL